MKLLKLHGELSTRALILLSVAGVGVVLLIWSLLTMGANPILLPATLPPPGRIPGAFVDLYRDNDIVRNTCQSIGLNLTGYLEAVLISVPVGFLIGLIPLFRGGFQFQVDAIRYVPLTAVTMLFIAWFGIGVSMKAHFLAFGILIYLLPMMVQRIDEVDDVYIKTVYTIGANAWQTFRTVYVPSVISRISDDIRVLTAISWTYIVVAENINSEGGIGSLIWRVGQRQGRVDKTIAMLIIIMVIGVLQDRLLVWLDKHLFPHKYQTKGHDRSGQIQSQSVIAVLLKYALNVLIWILGGVYILLFLNEFTGFLGSKPLSYLFGDTVISVHLLALSLIGFFGYKAIRNLVKKDTSSLPKQAAV